MEKKKQTKNPQTIKQEKNKQVHPEFSSLFLSKKVALL